MRFARATLVAVVMLLSATQASADKPRARVAYQLGIQHYNLAEYAEALAAFKEAYREFPDPTFLFNIGQCSRQLGDKSQAVKLYRSFLREVPAAPNRDEVSRLIETLERDIVAEQTTKAAPPQGTITPEIKTATVAPVAVIGAAPAAPTSDRHRRAAVIIGVSVAAAIIVGGLAVGLGVGLSRESTPVAATSGGTFQPRFQ